MASISICGRLTRDPEVKFFDSGTQVCRLSVADAEYVRPEKGQDKAPGQFYDLEVWGKFAELCADRLAKGSRIAATGRAIWREYETKDGRKGKALLVKDPSITFVDTRAEKEALGGGSSSFSEEEIPF